MPDWLTSTLDSSRQDVTLGELGLRMLAALVLGLCVAGVYRFVRRGPPAAPSFLATLVLLAVLIAMVTQIVGGNVALAFSLVGALSIVRFRTVVRDTQDTAYVIFSVVEGMAAGQSHLALGLVGLATVTLAALVMRPLSRRQAIAENDATLTVRLALSPHPEQIGQAVLDRHLAQRELCSAATVRQGGAIELKYNVFLLAGSSMGQLVADLNQVEGVQSVEISRRENESAE